MKLKSKFFTSFFLSFVVIILLTSMSFLLDKRIQIIFRSDFGVLLVRLLLVFVIAAIISLFQAGTFAYFYEIIFKFLKNLKKGNFRERIYIDKDISFYGVLDEIENVLDILDTKLKIIKDDISLVENALTNENIEEAKQKVVELKNMFENESSEK